MGSVLGAFKDERLPENYFRAQITILQIFGIELMGKEVTIYRIYSRVTVFVVVYLTTCLQAYEVYSQWGDLNTEVTALSYFLTTFIGAVKVTLLFFNRKKFGVIIKALHVLPFAPNVNRGGTMEERYVRNTVKTTEIQLAMFLMAAWLSLTSGVCVFLKSRIFEAKENWQYPFMLITLVKTTDSPAFEISSVCHIICIFTFATIVNAIYVLLSAIMAHLSAQFKILQNAFRNVRNKATSLNKFENPERNPDDYMKTILVEYVKHHLKVLEFAEIMRNLCSYMILVLFLSALLLLCLLLYQSSKFPIISMQFLQYLVFYWVIVSQVGMYCYWGNEVTLQAGLVADAVTEMDWPGAPLFVSKALVLIIARSQRPLQMTAGKFVPLSLDVLLKIIKASFSFYTMLKQTQEFDNNNSNTTK